MSKTIPAYWYLTVKLNSDGCHVKEWTWKPENFDNAYRIFEAYRNTVKNSAGEIHENLNYYILADSGWAELTYIEEKVIDNKPLDKGSGIVFMSYIPFGNLFNSLQNK